MDVELWYNKDRDVWHVIDSDRLTMINGEFATENLARLWCGEQGLTIVAVLRSA